MNETGSSASGTSGVIDVEGSPSMAHALDAQQRSVLERPEGATFAVIGAPGTGKTSTLIELVADRVLRCGFAPESILVLAASRQAATRLRDAVALRLGLVSNGPLARTASSAAFEIVRAAGAATAARSAGERARPVVLLTGAEQDRILAELLEGGVQDAEDGLAAVEWPDSLTPEVRRLRAFRTELRELMMRATENGVSASRLAQLGERFELPEWVAAAAFLRDYVSALEGFESAHLDSAELLAEARRLVREGGVLGHIRLIAVDELQEFPVGALNLVRELARAGAAVVAFGDPDAATAGFRGSDVRALGQLSRALGVPAEPPVVLRTSYRQRGAVRELTRRVTERIGAAAAGSQRATTDAVVPGLQRAMTDAVVPGLQRAMTDAVVPGSQRAMTDAVMPHAAPTDAGTRVAGGASAGARDAAGRSEVLRIQADSRAGEIASIARLLRERFLLHGVGWAKMAVIVRSGSLVPAVARGLALAEVPTRTLSAVQALRDDYAARHLAEGLALAMGRLEPTPAAVDSIILGPLCGVDPVGLRRLRLALRHDELAIEGSRHADELLREALFMPGALLAIDSAPARRVAALGTTLKLLAESHREGATVEELLWQLWQRTGLAKRWGDLAAGSGIVADEANRNLDGAVALFTAAKRSVEREPERAAELFIDEFLTAEVPEDTLSPRSRSESVLVTTPSGAVGAAVEIVVVAGLQESVWPNLRLRGSLLHAPRLSAVASGAAADLDQADDTRADVLADELRMFALAVSRSSRTTVLSCVANDDEQPSAFFGFAPDAGEYSAPRHPLSLRGLTGSLRRRVAVDGDRRAASVLARLASEQVPGADPAQWYGLKPSSTEEPVLDPADPDAVVRVSPSRIEAFEQSPLMWFIDQVAGGSKSLAAGIGTIVHSVMEKVSADPDAELSIEELMRESEQRWRELRFEAQWIEQREKRALGTKLGGLSDYLRDFSAAGDELLGAEAGFELRIGRAQLAGSIDRIERRHDGRVLVIDLKTGKYPLSKADLPGNAQLAAYQLAVRSGAVEGRAVPVDDDDPARVQGGAALLYVAKGEAGVRFTLRSQEPLDDIALQEITERIEKVAEGMAAARFPGVADPEERDLQNRYDYRIQLIKAVSE
ncbi:PD-(D/E)XK nuclease family protein [Herbiconiux sp. YIM B11900]|uniref:PD-(D/E)XK nuclease family protein n=1 Tax=Herbiconiux sp. YIM B11900 TaxID=3404131 RepID=UPI003F8583CA